MSRILVADDEEILRMLVTDTLEDEGYDIDEACDGNETYDLLCENQYDLLLLDYMMPGKTGLEIIQLVRTELNNHSLKILMLSAKSQKSDETKVLEAGANYFLAKPFSPVNLVELVGEILDENK